MTKKYEFVPIDDGYAAVDNTVSLSTGTRYWVSPENGKGYVIKSDYMKYGWPVIASFGIRIEEIPLIEPHDEKLETARKLAEDKFPIDGESSFNGLFQGGFVHGYMANPNQYTEADLLRYIDLRMKIWRESILKQEFKDHPEPFKAQAEAVHERAVKSLQKVPISVELEYINKLLFLSSAPGDKNETEDVLKITDPEANTITPISIQYA